jgi:hypothetical protein
MIDLFERFTNDCGTEFVLQEINRLLPGKRRVRSIQPSLGLLFIAEYPVGEGHNLKKPGKSTIVGIKHADQFGDARPDKAAIQSKK